MKFITALIPLMAVAATANPIMCPMVRRFVPDCDASEHRCGVCGTKCCPTEDPTPVPLNSTTPTVPSSTATSSEIPWITTFPGTRILPVEHTEGTEPEQAQ